MTGLEGIREAVTKSVQTCINEMGGEISEVDNLMPTVNMIMEIIRGIYVTNK